MLIDEEDKKTKGKVNKRNDVQNVAKRTCYRSECQSEGDEQKWNHG